MFITVFISIRIIHTVAQICHVQEGLLNNYKHQGKEGGRVISPAMMHACCVVQLCSAPLHATFLKPASAPGGVGEY